MVKTSASPQSAAISDIPQALKRKKEKGEEPILDGATKKKQRTRVRYGYPSTGLGILRLNNSCKATPVVNATVANRRLEKFPDIGLIIY